MTFHDRTHQTRRVLAAASAGAALLTAALLAGCGSDDSDPEPTDAAPLTPVSTDVNDLVLTAEETPEGFGYLNIGEMLAEQAGDGTNDDVFGVIDDINAGNSTDPAECLALQPNNLTVMAEINNRPDAVAVAEFTAEEPTVIDALVSTSDGAERLPADLTDCDTFTSTFTDTLTGEEGAVTYTLHAQTSDARIDGVPGARIISVTADEDAPDTWEPMNIVDGHVGDVYFRVSGHGSIDPQMLVGVAQTQVDRIAGK